MSIHTLYRKALDQKGYILPFTFLFFLVISGSIIAYSSRLVSHYQIMTMMKEGYENKAILLLSAEYCLQSEEVEGLINWDIGTVNFLKEPVDDEKYQLTLILSRETRLYSQSILYNKEGEILEWK
ncbi:hypothetical protein [Bacillus sp. 2205SS5-2]|uniref:hypothetical protein n=1 Tax=Bacillus sp. 2205SS5-2 TaxID=3109031 RepID=UPI00300792D7